LVIVDIGLHNGDRTNSMEGPQAASPRVQVVLATGGNSFGEAVSLAAGADGFLSNSQKTWLCFRKLFCL
jgi:hypothetical protein